MTNKTSIIRLINYTGRDGNVGHYDEPSMISNPWILMYASAYMGSENPVNGNEGHVRAINRTNNYQSAVRFDSNWIGNPHGHPQHPSLARRLHRTENTSKQRLRLNGGIHTSRVSSAAFFVNCLKVSKSSTCITSCFAASSSRFSAAFFCAFGQQLK